MQENWPTIQNRRIAEIVNTAYNFMYNKSKSAHPAQSTACMKFKGKGAWFRQTMRRIFNLRKGVGYESVKMA